MEIARRCIYCDHDAPESSPAIVMPFVAHRALGYAPVEITRDWGLRVQQNLVHGSDSAESAERELALWFA